MDKTWGYYILENHFRKYSSWPTSNGIKGCKGLIIFFINAIWALYPWMMLFVENTIDIYDKLFHLHVGIIGIVYLYMNLMWLYNRRSIFQIVNAMSDFRRFKKPSKLESTEKVIAWCLKLLQKIGRLSIFITVLVYSYYNRKCYMNTEHVKKAPITICELMVPYYVPFEVQPWQKTLIILLQVVSFTKLVYISVGIAFFCWYSAELIIIHLRDLKENVLKLSFSCGQKDCFELREVVGYHQHILSLFQLCFKTLHHQVVAIKVLILLSIALTSAKISLNPQISDVIIFFWCIVALGILYSVGQRIINANSEISNVVYSINWYDADKKIQKQVFMFLCESQRKLVLNFGIFGFLSYEVLTLESKRVCVWFQWLHRFLAKKS